MRDIARRHFPKRTLAVLGLVVALIVVGHLSPHDFDKATARGILPAVATQGAASSGTNTSWATWDEVTEAGWGDSSNTFIVLFENTVAGGNESGQGAGLAGANLVLTQVHNVPGAVASPSTRTLSDVNDGLTWTPAAITTILGDNTWTLIWKIKNYTAGERICFLRDLVNDEYMYLEAAGIPGTLRMYLEHNNAAVVNNLATAANIPQTDPVYICTWSDGVNVRWGFATSKPTKWSDFGANNRGSVASANGIIDTSDQDYDIIGQVTTAQRSLVAGYYYFVASKSCLIDNAS